jgi:hypothetical protein
VSHVALVLVIFDASGPKRSPFTCSKTHKHDFSCLDTVRARSCHSLVVAALTVLFAGLIYQQLYLQGDASVATAVATSEPGFFIDVDGVV